MTLGLKHGQNRLCAYSEDWPNQFQAESSLIRDACGPLITAIEHVGSTSVPGLLAKPIIDIAVGVDALDVADEMIPAMQTLGYDYPDDIGIPDDRIFGRDPGFRLFLVHVVVHESKKWRYYLGFRNTLRSNKQLSEEYAELKTEIVKKHPSGRGVYTELKSVFIDRVLKQDQ